MIAGEENQIDIVQEIIDKGGDLNVNIKKRN